MLKLKSKPDLLIARLRPFLGSMFSVTVGVGFPSPEHGITT
jgi:hypothetical protein